MTFLDYTLVSLAKWPGLRYQVECKEVNIGFNRKEEHTFSIQYLRLIGKHLLYIEGRLRGGMSSVNIRKRRLSCHILKASNFYSYEQCVEQLQQLHVIVH